MESIFKKLNDDILAAMRAKDAARLEVLRMMKSKVLNVNARGDLPDAEVIKILGKYAKSLRDSIEEYKKVNRLDAVAKIESEIKIISEYLPKQLSEEALRALVIKVMTETNATSAKEKGLVIKGVMAAAPGVEGGVVSKVVSELLK